MSYRSVSLPVKRDIHVGPGVTHSRVTFIKVRLYSSLSQGDTVTTHRSIVFRRFFWDRSSRDVLISSFLHVCVDTTVTLGEIPQRQSFPEVKFYISFLYKPTNERPVLREETKAEEAHKSESNNV